MQIARTAPKAATKPTANPAAKKTETFTVKLPEISAEDVVSTGWGVVDGIGQGLSQTRFAALEGAAGVIPVVGLLRSQHLRDMHGRGKISANNVNQLSNLSVSLGQIGGLGLTALSAASAVTGIGPAGSLIKAAGMSFAGAGLAGVVTGYATPY